MNAAMEGALECAARGWSVFPVSVGHDAKKCDGGTASCKTFVFPPKGWSNVSTADPDTIRSWDWPEYNGYGIDCGKSGLVVADQDPGDTWPFEATRVHTTGRGFHHIYEDMLGLKNAQGLQPWGVDVRGDGGLIIGPGSYHPHADGGVYSVSKDVDPSAPPPELVAALQRRHRASEHVEAGKADGTPYAELDSDMQAAVELAVANKTGYWRRRFNSGVEWDEGVHHYADRQGEEGGWELLTVRCAWSIACLVASPWSPVEDGLSLYEDIVPEEIRADPKCAGKFYNGIVKKARNEADLSFHALADEDAVTAAEAFAEVLPDDEPDRCQFMVDGGGRCSSPVWTDNDGWRSPHDCCQKHHVARNEDVTDEGDEKVGSTWQFQDVGAMLGQIDRGEVEKIMPTVCATASGQCLFYRGRINTLFGESGSGKTWVSLLATKQEIEAGNHAVFIDFEDDLASALLRLLAIGTDQDAIRQRFHYVQPEEKISKRVRKELVANLADLGPTLVVIDSTGESLAVEGKNPNQDEEVALWLRVLPKACTRSGAAVVVVDHVTKAADGNSSPIGSQRKKAGVFAMFRVETVEAFAKGVAGSARVVAMKDKAGNFRSGDAVAVLHASPGVGEDLDLYLEESAKDSDLLVGGYDERLFTKICDALQTAHDESIDDEWVGAGVNIVASLVSGNASKTRHHLKHLVRLGNVKREKKGQAMLHTLVSPYVPADVFDADAE